MKGITLAMIFLRAVEISFKQDYDGIVASQK